MRKFFFVVFLIVGVLMPLILGSAGSAIITLKQITLPDYFYQQTFDNLVLDFTITPSSADTLNALTVENEGTAKDMKEIEKVVLWSDNGNAKFDGFAVDAELATAAYNADSGVWAFSSLANAIPAAGKQYFVSLETRKSGTANKSFQFSLPPYSDVNGNKSFDSGDTGIFLASGNALPSGKLTNDSYSMYKALVADIWAPVAVFTNLTAGETIYGSSFKIKGKAKDQGGSVPEKVQVCIDSICYSALDTGANYSTWEYNWSEIEEGAHSIYVKSNDFNANSTQTAKISVTTKLKKVDAPGIFSATNSSVVFNKATAKADGVDYIKASVVLKDTNSNAIAGKKILVKAIYANGELTIDFGNTSASGGLTFKWRSSEEGALKIKFITEDNNIIKDVSTINFAEVDNFVDYTSGSWLKTESSKAVYFLDKKNVRHAYPTQQVWESYFGKDFSSVQTISDAKMAEYALGTNVPFKFGALMKIPSVKKVYYVSKNGVLAWIPTEEAAVSLFGSSWAKKVRDLPESFWTDYVVGENLE